MKARLLAKDGSCQHIQYVLLNYRPVALFPGLSCFNFPIKQKGAVKIAIISDFLQCCREVVMIGKKIQEVPITEKCQVQKHYNKQQINSQDSNQVSEKWCQFWVRSSAKFSFFHVIPLRQI